MKNSQDLYCLTNSVKNDIEGLISMNNVIRHMVYETMERYSKVNEPLWNKLHEVETLCFSVIQPQLARAGKNLNEYLETVATKKLIAMGYEVKPQPRQEV